MSIHFLTEGERQELVLAESLERTDAMRGGLYMGQDGKCIILRTGFRITLELLFERTLCCLE